MALGLHPVQSKTRAQMDQRCCKADPGSDAEMQEGILGGEWRIVDDA